MIIVKHLLHLVVFFGLQAFKRKCEELKLVQKEKSEVSRDHELMLGERDSVHKELESLREQLMERNSVVSIFIRTVINVWSH